MGDLDIKIPKNEGFSSNYVFSKFFGKLKRDPKDFDCK